MSWRKVAVLAFFSPRNILPWYTSKNTNAIKSELNQTAARKGQIFITTTTTLLSIKTKARELTHQVNDVAVHYQKPEIKWRFKDL